MEGTLAELTTFVQKKRFAGIFRNNKRKNKGQPDVDEQANNIATRLQASLGKASTGLLA